MSKERGTEIESTEGRNGVIFISRSFHLVSHFKGIGGKYETSERSNRRFLLNPGERKMKRNLRSAMHSFHRKLPSFHPVSCFVSCHPLMAVTKQADMLCSSVLVIVSALTRPRPISAPQAASLPQRFSQSADRRAVDRTWDRAGAARE